MGLTADYQQIIDNAIKAIDERAFFAQYPEHPKAYGPDAPAKGEAAFKSAVGKKFEELLQGRPNDWIGEEVSPYTKEALGIQYPSFEVDTLIIRAARAFGAWKKVDIDTRANVLVDALERVKERFFEIAHATQHTTGQSFMMSFQASGPHSNDRALEALALAYQELKRYPSNVVWDKPMGKFNVKLDKKFKPVPKGIGLVIGCSTFPVWNSVPGIFATLMTGNTCIVKPHSLGVYPIAIVVAEIQKALQAADLDPNSIQLAVDHSENLITKDLAENDMIQIIDYTGGSTFGGYIESLENKTTFTEKAGVNSVILDSMDDLDAVLNNIAFSLSLYSGQMCTAPQNIFIPKNGVKVGGEQVDFDTVAQKLTEQLKGIASHPKMGAGTLGAIQNEVTLKRVQSVVEWGETMVLEPAKVESAEYADARVCSPVVLQLESRDIGLYENELFGPIVMLVKTNGTHDSIRLAREMAKKHGAITCGAYCTDPALIEEIEEEMESVFTPVSLNLTGPIWMNQHAAFSDFHVTGGNPAGNASFTNPEYVNKRFVWVGHRTIAK